MTRAPIAHLIANTKSGRGKGASLADDAAALCAELGYKLICYDTSASFERAIKAATAAALADGGVLIAAGGDGTIRGVAQEAAGLDLRFAAVPVGTFNFFARTHRIPEDHIEALRLALTGSTRPVRLGEVNGHIFLINASLGLYAKAIREREEATSRFGRHRLVVILSTLGSFFGIHRPYKVDLVADGKVKSLSTPMIFIGNNALQLRDLKMDVARCMNADLLAVVLMRPLAKFETLRILWRGITKTLEDDQKLETFCVSELTIYTRHTSHEIALDGEIFRMASPLKIGALPRVLVGSPGTELEFAL